MIILELEDHAGPATGEDVLRRIQLPAGVRSWIDEPPPGRARSLPRLHPGHASFAEDPCQRRDRWRVKTHRLHPVVDADRTVIQPRRFERSTDLHGLIHDLLDRASRAKYGDVWSAARAQPLARRPGRGLAGRRTSCGRSRARRRRCSPPREARHQATVRWRGGQRDRQARFCSPPILDRRSVTTTSSPKCHRCPDTELSPMSCDITRAPTSVVGPQNSPACGAGRVIPPLVRAAGPSWRPGGRPPPPPSDERTVRRAPRPTNAPSDKRTDLEIGQPVGQTE